MKSLETAWQDIVFAARLLRKSPVFTSAVVLTFALGVGVNTAMFSVVNAIVLRPLPVRDGDRLVGIASQDIATLFNKFKDYKIATVTRWDMPIKDVAPIFERINSTGTPLTIVDLMRAATWSPDFDLIDTIDSILAELENKNFGAIDKKVVLRNLSSAAGGEFSADSIDSLRMHSPAVLTTAADRTREAYRLAVDFLTTQIGIPRAEVIP